MVVSRAMQTPDESRAVQGGALLTRAEAGMLSGEVTTPENSR